MYLYTLNWFCMQSLPKKILLLMQLWVSASQHPVCAVPHPGGSGPMVSQWPDAWMLSLLWMTALRVWWWLGCCDSDAASKSLRSPYSSSDYWSVGWQSESVWPQHMVKPSKSFSGQLVGSLCWCCGPTFGCLLFSYPDVFGYSSYPDVYAAIRTNCKYTHFYTALACWLLLPMPAISGTTYV